MWPAACSFFLLNRDKLFFSHTVTRHLGCPDDPMTRVKSVCVRHHGMRNVEFTISEQHEIPK